MSEAAPAPAVNLFGLTQYDGLTTFFGDQSFDYNGYVLPEVRIEPAFPPTTKYWCSCQSTIRRKMQGVLQLPAAHMVTRHYTDRSAASKPSYDGTDRRKLQSVSLDRHWPCARPFPKWRASGCGHVEIVLSCRTVLVYPCHVAGGGFS